MGGWGVCGSCALMLLGFALAGCSVPASPIGSPADAIVGADSLAQAEVSAQDSYGSDAKWSRDPRCAAGYCSCCGLCQFNGTGSQCHATTAADCLQSSNCAGPNSSGACMLGPDGQCQEGPDDAACSQSSACKGYGKCTFAGGHCVPAKQADCQGTTICKQSARCSILDGECVPQTDADCAGSDLCKADGQCHFVKGFETSTQGNVTYDGGCHPIQAADCANSTGCATYGNCKYSAKKGACTK